MRLAAARIGPLLVAYLCPAVDVTFGSAMIAAFDRHLNTLLRPLLVLLTLPVTLLTLGPVLFVINALMFRGPGQRAHGFGRWLHRRADRLADLLRVCGLVVIDAAMERSVQPGLQLPEASRRAHLGTHRSVSIAPACIERSAVPASARRPGAKACCRGRDACRRSPRRPIRPRSGCACGGMSGSSATMVPSRPAAMSTANAGGVSAQRDLAVLGEGPLRRAASRLA